MLCSFYFTFFTSEKVEVKASGCMNQRSAAGLGRFPNILEFNLQVNGKCGNHGTTWWLGQWKLSLRDKINFYYYTVSYSIWFWGSSSRLARLCFIVKTSISYARGGGGGVFFLTLTAWWLIIRKIVLLWWSTQRCGHTFVSQLLQFIAALQL